MLLLASLSASSAVAKDATCADDLGCFALWYSAQGAVLGAKATLSHVQAGRGVEAAALMSYRTELHATHDELAGHLLAFGSLGGGSAGTEGSLGGSLDFGWRAPVSENSGPFVRAGPSGVLLGHDRLRVSLFEPVQARLGYQLLDSAALIESGFTLGVVALGRYEPGVDRSRNLASAAEIGGYVAAHTARLRVDVALRHFAPTAGGPPTGVDLVELAACAYRQPLALCAELSYANGAAYVRGKSPRLTNAIYSGLTLGFTP
jgi:hypothetical protein